MPVQHSLKNTSLPENNFYQFEAGNNGSDYYHFNQRLWEDEENFVRRIIRNFQSQGVYFHSPDTKLCLVKSVIPVPENEKSVFDGLDKR